MTDDAAVRRILDANFNRAREALRVIEDYARYGLDCAPAAHALKQLRHDLQAALKDLAAAGGLVLSRAVDGDVGREDKLPTEAERSDALGVAGASFSRLQQALRSIEEYGKLADPAIAGAVERLRYRSYEIEQMLLARARPVARLVRCRLMVLVTEKFAQGRSHAEVAEAALTGGADMIQLRVKEMADGEILQIARQLRDVTDRHGAMLIINDRPDVAALVNADGVHLGRGDLPAPEARRIMRPGCVIGSSTHNPDEAAAALRESADYLALGQIFESRPKETGNLAGLEYIRWAAEHVPVPTLAIGGITADNAADVIAAGAHGVAVCTAVIATENIEAAARQLRERLDEASERRGSG